MLQPLGERGKEKGGDVASLSPMSPLSPLRLHLLRLLWFPPQLGIRDAPNSSRRCQRMNLFPPGIILPGSLPDIPGSLPDVPGSLPGAPGSFLDPLCYSGILPCYSWIHHAKDRASLQGCPGHIPIWNFGCPAFWVTAERKKKPTQKNPHYNISPPPPPPPEHEEGTVPRTLRGPRAQI